MTVALRLFVGDLLNFLVHFGEHCEYVLLDALTEVAELPLHTESGLAIETHRMRALHLGDATLTENSIVNVVLGKMLCKLVTL